VLSVLNMGGTGGPPAVLSRDDRSIGLALENFDATGAFEKRQRSVDHQENSTMERR
jgi:hypothetical protein